MSAPAQAETVYSILDFDDLDDWAEDDHQAALDTFRNTCRDMKNPDWQTLCRAAQDQQNARAFFELFFRPLLIEDGKKMIFTGYFEPELDGSRTKTARYKYPIYAMPRDVKTAGQWYTRRQILEDGVMDGLNLEICYVDDPVELFFLQIQGSGRVRLPDGSFLRVGFGGSNRHNYRSIGTELVRRGLYQSHQVSAEVIKNWVRRNPEAGKELLYHNPSYVFFREVSEVPADKGPLGAMNRSITTMRSVAVDPKFTPLGAPVWIEKDGDNPLRRLMVAQDTGSAIKGAQRADLFFGTGDEAGKQAGRLRDPGRMVVLMPIQRAYAYLPENVQ
ncbi:murein transglycosylase A [Planktotalea sp.]|uniref:murein transglycosylase A n=1 Tax=Planktotalea sp. TaxID=2029877 RepID=UPI0035C797D9